MRRLALALLLAGVPALAGAPQPGTAGFAVALGQAVFTLMTDQSGVNGRVVVRRLGLDGGVAWETRWGSGRNETPVEAAVTTSGTLVVAGDLSDGCFVSRWGGSGRLLWTQDLRLGDECRARTVVVDANSQSYVLTTTAQNGVFAATVWKLDRHGRILWSYRDEPGAPDYAFEIALSAQGRIATVTTVRRDAAAWRYARFALNEEGSVAPSGHY